MDKYKIVALGKYGFSGVYEYLYPILAKKHEIVKVIETTPIGFSKYWNALYCFRQVQGVHKYLHPIRTILSEEVTYFRQRTKYHILKKAEYCENR